MNNRLIKSNDAGGGGCTNTVDLYNPFPDGGGVALYQLNGDATDVSGNYDGTATNVTYGAGQFGQAGVFNGSSSYIGIDTNSWNSLTSYTASFWIYDTGTATGGRTMVSNYGYTAASNVEKGWIIMRVGTKLRISNATTGLASTYLSTNDIPFNQWAHIVVTNTQSEIKIYFNGVLDSTHTTNGFLNDASWPMRPAIGVYRYETTETRNGYFNGSIDQVRIFNRALRPYEVEALYTEEYCTPTIVPSEHFNTVLYTGDNTSSKFIDVGFTPDLVWLKSRDTATSNALYDTVRGNNLRLVSNGTGAEDNVPNELVTGGFNIIGGTGYNDSSLGNQVAWNFKAGGAAVTNTDGTITSQVSANTEAGFSVVKQVPNNTNQTYGHGLGVAPSVIISKNLNVAGAWGVYHKDLGTGKYLFLNTTAAVNPTVNANVYPVVNDTVFSGGSGGWNSTTGGENAYINYCFAEVEGFSNFGSYVGNLSSQTNIVTGFEPAFVMIKCSSGFNSGRWNMYDNKRSTTNPNQKVLFADLAGTEGDNIVFGIDFYENGFSIPTTCTSNSVNQTGYTYIYMAFAADPTAVEPTLEDSFNTVLYTGNGGTQSVTGVGFQPDFTWIKSRSGSGWNAIFDAVRGVKNVIFTNDARAEELRNEALTLFNTDGFTVVDTFNGDGSVNGAPGGAYSGAAGTYVAWNWKGAEIPAINSNGSIPSVVSANPAAGFSIVSYTTPTTNNFTVGHGLNDTPKILIIKGRSLGSSWTVYSSEIGASNYLQLNSTNASTASSLPFNNTAPNNSVFTLGSSTVWYGTNAQYIAYCFAEVAGFSKIGSYTGTGNTSGNIITTGFEPAFIMIKCSTTSTNWVIYDNKRDTANPRDHILIPNTSGAEVVGYPGTDFDFNSTSFQAKGNDAGINASGQTYIYMAFANQF